MGEETNIISKERTQVVDQNIGEEKRRESALFSYNGLGGKWIADITLESNT